MSQSLCSLFKATLGSFLLVSLWSYFWLSKVRGKSVTVKPNLKDKFTQNLKFSYSPLIPVLMQSQMRFSCPEKHFSRFTVITCCSIFLNNSNMGMGTKKMKTKQKKHIIQTVRCNQSLRKPRSWSMIQRFFAVKLWKRYVNTFSLTYNMFFYHSFVLSYWRWQFKLYRYKHHRWHHHQ